MKVMTFNNGVFTSGIAVSSEDADAHFVDFMLAGDKVTLAEVIEGLLKDSHSFHYSPASVSRKLLLSIDGSKYPGAVLCLIKYSFEEECVEIGAGGVSIVSVGDRDAGVRLDLVLVPLNCSVAIVRNNDLSAVGRELLYEIRNTFGELYLHCGKVGGVWFERDSRLYARVDSDGMLMIIPDSRAGLSIEAKLFLLNSSGWELLRSLTVSVSYELLQTENGNSEADSLMPVYCAQRQVTQRLMDLAELLYPKRLSNPNS